MRAPLSWLRDFAPFDPGDPAPLVETLDDLGLVVEGLERVGEGLEDVVVARVENITSISGADRIRLVTVDAGDGGPVDVVCGAWNFEVGDLVPLAPVGAVLPGGFEIGRRKMKGVVSNGMLCSGRELRLSDDHEGILVLDEVEGAHPGLPLAEALGIEPDVVFDITVEGNRPDAWSISGVARDLAGRLGLAFALPGPVQAPDSGMGVDSMATLVVDDRDLCPRMTVRVLDGVHVGPSPRWLARRLLLAGMRPINNVVDASNYVMLELGQPTHPYDLDRLAGPGLLVRRAKRGESVTTLDGVERAVGVPGRGLGDTGEDCLICDADGMPVGIGGIMGGASSEISETTTRVLLEAAYFTPMAIARTSKRLGLRTEASARFERGVDPWGIDRAAARFCELVGAPVAHGVLDVRGEVPEPMRLEVPVARVSAVLGVPLDADRTASLLEPIGFGCEILNGDATAGDATAGDATNGDATAGDATNGDATATLLVTVPTNRPDVRPAPYGVDDVIEEIGRTFGYSKIPRRQPSWPEPGGLTAFQKDRRLVREVLCGVGGREVWTASLVDGADHTRMGLTGPAVGVANPIAKDEAWLRRSMLPGLLRALGQNANRRLGPLRLFEIGTVFSHPDERSRTSRVGAGGGRSAVLPAERELLSTVFAAEGDDAKVAVAAWRVLARVLRLEPVEMVADSSVPGLHPTRSARLMAAGGPVGSVGEVDPAVAAHIGSGEGRVGWLEVDLGLLLTRAWTPRRSETAKPVSRFPSAEIDLAFVVPDEIPASQVEKALESAPGERLESVELFDVYRGPSVPAGHRSLAFRLRFSAFDHTLNEGEVASLRQACIDAAVSKAGAALR